MFVIIYPWPLPDISPFIYSLMYKHINVKIINGASNLDSFFTPMQGVLYSRDLINTNICCLIVQAYILVIITKHT